MNPQMMQYGNQPGGYSQSGNFTGSFSSGGGPPPPGSNPPLGSFPPSSTQFQQTVPQPKNLAGPPTSMGSVSYMGHPGSQGMPNMSSTGSFNNPPNFHTSQQQIHGSGPLNGPPGSQNQYAAQNSGPLNGPLSSQLPNALQTPGSSNCPQLPHSPPSSGPSHITPSPQPQHAPSSGPSHVAPGSQPQHAPSSGPSHVPSGSLPPHAPPSSGPAHIPSGSQLPHAPPSTVASNAPLSSQLPHSLSSGPPSGPPGTQPPQAPPVSGPLNGPSTGGPVSQSSASINRPSGLHGPPVSQMLGSQSFLSGPSGPLTSTANQGHGQQFGSPHFNGPSGVSAQNMMSHPQGQTDPARQYINGAPQGLHQGGPPLQQRPMNYGPPGSMPPPSGGGKPMYPQMSNLNQQSPTTPPYPQSQQIRSPYPPAPGTFNKDNYPSGPMQPQTNDLRQGYHPTNQGPYQQMNQQYSGLNQNYIASPSYPQPQSEHKTQRKLDPDMLPSPIQVMQDDERNRSGIFYTEHTGLMPPLVTTNFVTQDQGNCSPRFLRSTTYNVPATADLLKQTSVPFALLISPLARLAEGEQAPPIVNMGELGPVRCIRCKAYMSPFMQFIDGGRRFHCVFCKATTEVPAEYFQHLDHTGQRVDRFERPELVLGAYEFIVTKDYCKNNQPPEPPAVIFVIDVSYNNVKSGLVHLLCSKMKEIIRNLPKDEGHEVSNMRVGFITYSTSVHFYNIKSCLAAPQMMLVGDVNEMFMPLLDGFLCDPLESEPVIDLLMQEIPKQFADTRETETILYPAIQAGLEALKASNRAGKLLVFHSSLPIAEAPGKLRNRDDRKLLHTEKEKTVLAPQNNSYNNLGQECVQAGCSVDLFIFNNSYVDIATIGEVSRLSGGEIFKYTYFQADIDGERFIADLKRNVSRQIAFDAVMRVRTSTGIRPTDFYGHFFMSNTKDMELGSIDSDKAVAVEIKHDDKLTEEDGVYIQVALLYTSCSGQRRLRILNLSLKICTQMADLYRCCDLDTLVNYFSKQGIFKLLESSPKQIKNSITDRCANILACYRKNCANPSSIGQLILPECIKLLPLYINTLLKSDAFSGGSDMTCDDRSFAMHCVMIMDLPVSVVYFYPRLIALHNINPDTSDTPFPIRCTYEKLQDDGVYLLDNGIHMFMWLGLAASTSFISNVFGVPTAPQVDTDKSFLPPLDNPLSLRIRKLIDDIREKRHRSMRLTILKQRDKMEMVFKQYLMEDNGADGSPSYADFLCQMHNQIRTILS